MIKSIDNIGVKLNNYIKSIERQTTNDMQSANNAKGI